MDINELVEKVADGMPVRKDFVFKLIKKMVKEIVDTVVKGESVHVRGFGRFQSVKRAARLRRHPRTGVVGQSPATTGVKFVAARSFLDVVSAKKTPGGG